MSERIPNNKNNTADSANKEFEELLNKHLRSFKPGDIVSGKVVRLTPNGAFIDIDAKKDAFIRIKDMSLNWINSPEDVLQKNQIREFYILDKANEEGQFPLSLQKIEQMLAWERVRQLQAEDVTVRSSVFDTNRGGALVRIEGLRGFVPSSHISTRKPKEELVGEELPLKFLEVDEERNNIVLSHRRALVERKRLRFEVGEVVIGTVRGIKPYGAFIDIGGVSGLLPLGEISHAQIDTPHSVFNVNDEIKSLIIDLDAERGRIMLSTKALEREPGDMLRNPQLVYDYAEEMAIRYQQRNVSPEASLTTNTYELIVLVSSTQLTVGQSSHLQVKIEPATFKSKDPFQIPANLPELQCFVSTDGGLRIVDLEAATISIDPETGHPLPASFELQGYLRGKRTYKIELFIEDPESGKLNICKSHGEIIVNPPRASEKSLTILPTLPTLNISVVPQANFVLLIETELPDGDDDSYFFTYYLTSRLRALKLRQQEVGKVKLQSNQLKRMCSLLARTIQFATNAKPEDAREQMISVGCFLFDMLFPAETTAFLRDAFWQVADQISTWLVIEDGITWLPWELVVPYRDDNNEVPRRFLCERYFLSRWIQGLGIPPYNEVPLGEIAIAHYKILDTQDEKIEAWKQLLQASVALGIPQAVHPETPFYGLHLLRCAEEFNRRDIVARDVDKFAETPEEEEVAKSRLDLRLKRPIITLSIINNNDVSQNTGEFAIIERVLPFLRLGASAVVGCCWQTSEVAERIFWSQFYELLTKGFSLGEVVWRSRLAVERALPHRLDWLAYTLFGDPCAKPYEPEVSSGYSVLECLNPDEPFQVGKTYYFRVSIRKRPPVWYKDKLIKTEELSNQLRALFMAPGLQTSFPQPVEMQPVGHHMRQATLSLKPQQEGDYLLLVQILEGEELLKMLQLNIKVQEIANG